ncbi:MAG: c-type cytochrome biogenesis protein CcmI [Sedimenticola sp.]|nr:c-type cytochrome biogenesis protein CcmI [Sedimenticola sp.]
MILFWIITAVMILAALAFVAPPLLRQRTLADSDRDRQNVVIARERLDELDREHAAGSLSEAEYEQTKLELEQALLNDLEEAGQDVPDTGAGSGGRWWVALAAAFFVSLATLFTYLSIGTPQMIDPAAMQAQLDEDLPSVEEMATALVERLKENPEDPEGWYLLGRTYMAMENYREAAFAFDKVNQMVGKQPSIMLALADALAMAAGGNMQGHPASLVREAVTLAPNDETALWLAGMVEDQSGNHVLALRHWRHLKGMLADNPESLQRVDMLIAGAERKMAAAGETVPPEQSVEPVASGTAISARITLSADLASRAAPEESLFVYARALEGPRMPLAAVRLKVSDLPTTVKLEDGQAMVPGMNLSSVGQVVVGARISRSGNAIASSGDLLGEVSPVTVGDGQVIDLEINSVIP